MKTLFLVLFLIIPISAQAQGWTTEQQEAIDAVKGCWIVWNEAELQKNYDIYSEQCSIEGKTMFWWSGLPAPHSPSEFQHAMKEGLLSWGVKRSELLAVRPIFVQLEGEFAFVYYAPSYVQEDLEGNVTTYNQKRFAALQKVNGKWKLFGSMGAPAGGDN